MYSLCHAEDVDKIKKMHTDLIKKGQVMSHYYRLLNRRGGYTWMQTCCTLVCSSKNSDEQQIISVNYVLSQAQFSTYVMSLDQVNEPPVSLQIKPEVEMDKPENRKGQGSLESLEGSGYHIYDTAQDTQHHGHQRLGQTSVETSDSGLKDTLKEKEDNLTQDETKGLGGIVEECSNSSSPHSASPLPTSRPSSRFSDKDAPDTNAQKDPEKPKDLSRNHPLTTTPTLEASNLLKQLFSSSHRSAYLNEDQFFTAARLAGQGAAQLATPAQPIPLKPHVYPGNHGGGLPGHGLEAAYSGGFTDQNIYSHSSSFQLYNRGQSWYGGN